MQISGHLAQFGDEILSDLVPSPTEELEDDGSKLLVGFDDAQSFIGTVSESEDAANCSG